MRRPRYPGKNPRRFEDKYKELNPERYATEVEKVLASGKTPAGMHRPIMVDEVLGCLEPRHGDVAVDCTLGGGGHAQAILERILPGGRLVGLDVDPLELPRTEARLRAAGFDERAFVTRQGNFAGLAQVIAAEGLAGADIVLADLGVSSMQIDNPARGFSYKEPGPLDMRMNPSRGEPASDLLARVSEETLAHLLTENADEPHADLIAGWLKQKPVNTTHAVERLVRTGLNAAFPTLAKTDVKMSVRRTFQALRIAVNDEFAVLDALLRALPRCLTPGGRAAILTFHSGEDRRVKKAFQSGERDGTYSSVAQEVIRSTKEETFSNRRASAAKLRWAVRALSLVLVLLAASSVRAHAQAVDMSTMDMSMPWRFMQDGVVFATVDHQGGPRGGDQFVAPNWWMGMASRGTSHGTLTLTSMFSLDPATVGKSGYRELFQTGEALHGRPIIDRQHPHDFFMQLAAVWRSHLPGGMAVTIAAAPAGEAALGPVAFMHRASAADNPTAPLSHHTFDSTHVSFGVIAAGVDRGPWAIEGSLFNGREPDENRWDFDFARLDSVAGRIWFRPNSEWEMQVSTGHLKHPETFEPGNIDRSTASVAWTRRDGPSVASVTVAYGRNDTDHGARSAAFVEAARHAGANTLYGRFEVLQTETALLESGTAVSDASPALKDPLLAFTVGGVRDVIKWRGFEGGLGADVSLYDVPRSLQPMYSAHPASAHVFFRVRPPSGAMGRMWNMKMAQPMTGHQM